MLSMDALDGVRAKLTRATETLVTLDDEIGFYLDSGPVDVRREVTSDGVNMFCLAVTASPPARLSVLAGEVVHQMRSALDHIAHDLVRSAGNEPTRQTAFPIHAKKPSRVSIAGGVTPEVLALVDAVQPYHADEPDTNPLHVLHFLWNEDKHRNIHLITAGVARTQAFLSPPGGQVLLGGQFQTRPVFDGEPFAAFEVDGGVPEDAELTAMGDLFVSLGAPRSVIGVPAAEVLESLLNCVRHDLVPLLAPHVKGT
jgi:hypothetical protein